LERELSAGTILVESFVPEPIRERNEAPEIELPPLPPPRRESTDTFFEVRFVDEIGRAVNRLPVELEADGELRSATTNAAGVALIEHVVSSSASVEAPESKSLSDILDPRWEKPRAGTPPKESNTTEVVFRGAPIGPVSLKPVVPNTVVIKPPLGKLFVELYDRTGRTLHREREYTIDGPMRFSGKTDADGRLLHEQVFPGDYTLTLTLEFFEGSERQTDVFEAPLIVLEPSASEPEVRMLGIVPRVVLARLRLFFNTNKSFLLPTAMPSIKRLREIYADNTPSQLLVVGHADTQGKPDYNEQLSLERSEATIAYLKDDVDAWLSRYDAGVEAQKRWGSAEDRMMIAAMPDFVTKPKGQKAVEWFQKSRGLEVDGKAGPDTRRRLITEYMALDGVSLADAGFEIDATAHGCGENFPLDETEEELDESPPNETRDRSDRRVELFFFEPEFGILPVPPGEKSAAGSSEYPEWREAVTETFEFSPDDQDRPEFTFVELADALFRTDSAVVLPEGQTPAEKPDERSRRSSLGAFATALRFNDEHPDRSVFLAGHADTTGEIDYNQTLSEERAQVALAMLEGGGDNRDKFKTLCDGRHTVADYKEILAWAAAELGDLGFDCDPGAIDDNESTGVEPVRRFQAAYNANREALNPEADELEVDGDVGPLTWGAIFDCYELGLARELGVDADGLAELRANLVFVDPERKALGFSEHFPIEELGVDDYESQLNRRVEILFFEEGEEPDLEHAEDDPETSEVYLPGFYERTPLESSGGGNKRSPFTLFLESQDGDPVPEIEFVLTDEDGTAHKGKLDKEGKAVVRKLRPDTNFTVEYLDHDEIRARCLAGRLRRALDGFDAEAVLGVLARPRSMFDRVKSAIDSFFPGKGDLVDEILSVAKGHELERPIRHYLAGLELLTDSEQAVIAYNEPDPEADGAAPDFGDSGETVLV
jgi:outer membrane protein OmpA-like peptidoglycan-associated protein